MQTVEFSDLSIRVQKIIQRFVEPYVLDPNVVGIMLVGSYANSKPDKNSDLDIYIVVENSEDRERGNRFIDGIEIEYFINPIMQIYHYMKDESVYRPHTVHMFATGLIVYKQRGSNHLDKLISEAKKRRMEPIPELDHTQIELARYGLDDMYKDAQDMFEKKDKTAYYLICGDLVSYGVDIFFKIHQSEIPKIKQRPNVIAKMDPKFAELIRETLDSNYAIEKIKELVAHLENLIGGKRPDIWRLKGPLTIK